MHSSLIGKIQKANRYAEEPERISFQQFQATFKGDHDSYEVSYKDGSWTCGCNFFSSWGVCSHTMTFQKLLGVMVPRQETEAQPDQAMAKA